MGKETLKEKIRNIVYKIILPIYLWSINYRTLKEYVLDLVREAEAEQKVEEIKKILEEYTSIYLSNYIETVKANEKEYVREYVNIKRLELCDNKIRIEYVDTVVFKCSIDIYINILETYNFIARIFKILNIL